MFPILIKIPLTVIINSCNIDPLLIEWGFRLVY